MIKKITLYHFQVFYSHGRYQLGFASPLKIINDFLNRESNSGTYKTY